MPVPEAAPHIGDGAPVGTCLSLCLSASQATSHEAWDPRGSGSTQGGFLFISPTQAQVYHHLCPWTWLRFLLFCLYVFKFFVSNCLHFPPALTRPLKPIATAPQSVTLRQDPVQCASSDVLKNDSKICMNTKYHLNTLYCAEFEIPKFKLRFLREKRWTDNSFGTKKRRVLQRCIWNCVSLSYFCFPENTALSFQPLLGGQDPGS